MPNIKPEFTHPYSKFPSSEHVCVGLTLHTRVQQYNIDHIYGHIYITNYLVLINQI